MHTVEQLERGELTGIRRLDLSADLQHFPEAIFALADTLEVLNLSGNRLNSLPSDLSRLRKLRILFCSDNLFTEVPGCLGDRKSVVEGKRVSVRVDLGGPRIIKKK